MIQNILVIAGTLLGGIISIITTLIVIYFTNKREKMKNNLDVIKFILEKREHSYQKVIHDLFNILNVEINEQKEKNVKLSKIKMKEWFECLSETRSSMETLLFYCSEENNSKIELITDDFFNLSSLLLGFKIKTDRFHAIIAEHELIYDSFVEYINKLIVEVSNCARIDMRVIDNTDLNLKNFRK